MAKNNNQPKYQPGDANMIEIVNFDIDASHGPLMSTDEAIFYFTVRNTYARGKSGQIARINISFGPTNEEFPPGFQITPNPVEIGSIAGDSEIRTSIEIKTTNVPPGKYQMEFIIQFYRVYRDHTNHRGLWVPRIRLITEF